MEAHQSELRRHLVQVRQRRGGFGALASANQRLVRGEGGALNGGSHDETLLTRELDREWDEPGDELKHLDEDGRFLHLALSEALPVGHLVR